MSWGSFALGFATSLIFGVVVGVAVYVYFTDKLRR